MSHTATGNVVASRMRSRQADMGSKNNDVTGMCGPAALAR